MKLFICIATIIFFNSNLFAQPDRWQQRVKYTMAIDMDVETNRFSGKQQLEYSNNSPEAFNFDYKIW